MSSAARGQEHPVRDLVPDHYTGRRGIDVPYVRETAERVRPEDSGGEYGSSSGGYDQLGLGTLAHHR